MTWQYRLVDIGLVALYRAGHGKPLSVAGRSDIGKAGKALPAVFCGHIGPALGPRQAIGHG